MGTKTGIKSVHKGLDYGSMTSDVCDGPRDRKDRRDAKRYAAKRQRRKAKKDIEDQVS